MRLHFSMQGPYASRNYQWWLYYGLCRLTPYIKDRVMQ